MNRTYSIVHCNRCNGDYLAKVGKCLHCSNGIYTWELTNDRIVKLMAEEMRDERYSMTPWVSAGSDEEDGKYGL